MTRQLLCTLALLCMLYISPKTELCAQAVGIGTNNPAASSMLDIQSTNRGLLIPRMTTSQRNAIASPANGLMVYDITLNEVFWFKNGSWTNVTPGNSTWSLTGNAGTNAGNFIGTTDANDVRFRVNNTHSGYLGYGIDANVAFGYKSLLSLTSGVNNVAIGYTTMGLNTTGYNNTAVGDSALYAHTQGHDNTAIGYKSQLSLTNAIGNIAIGSYALFSNNTGNQNVGVGLFSLTKNKASGNTAIGTNSLSENTTGTGNMAGGNITLEKNTTGSWNSAIGGLALSKNETGNYNAVLGYDAMRNNLQGSKNTASGYYSMYNTNGNNNTAIGANTMEANVTGNHNTAVGYMANMGNANLENATAIGAMAIVNQSNSLVLGSIENMNGATHSVKVGIGTTTPKAALHVADSSVLFEGLQVPVISTPGPPPASGQGRRMMWYADRASFRTGYVNGNQWDYDSVGNYSFAGGINTKATGIASFAYGNNARAKGSYSIALGRELNAENAGIALGDLCVATGSLSLAFGASCQALGGSSIAMGQENKAYGVNAVAIGDNSIAGESGSLALGGFSQALAVNATAIGAFNKALKPGAFAAGNTCTVNGLYAGTVGLYNSARSYGSFVIGRLNDSIISSSPDTWVDTDPVFIIGNGVDPNSRSNALLILKNGNIGIGTNTPGAGLHMIDKGLVAASNGLAPGSGTTPVSGAGRRMMWYPEKAAFRAGYVSGSQWDNANTGNYSFASGFDVRAGGAYSVALGKEVTAGATGSFFFGDSDPNNKGVRTTNTANQFAARFNGGFYLISSDAGLNDVGVSLPSNGNSWSVASDVNLKENFIPIDGEDLLQKIAEMPQTTWNYKGQDPSTYRHYGPMAQDFYAAFGRDELGTIGCDTLINQQDFLGVNLGAIQALEKRTANLQEQLILALSELAEAKREIKALKNTKLP